MKNINISLMAEALAAYAIERQNGIERYQPPGTPLWSEQRRFWTDAILQSMARLEGIKPDLGLMEQYDQRLKEARSCTSTKMLSPKEQDALIRELNRFISALEDAGDDRRRQIAVIRDLLEDMSCHLPWSSCANRINSAQQLAEDALLRITAKLPIRFTRILLGWESGPCESGYASGAVTTAGEVKDTPLYAGLAERYPEVSDWPTLCVVYNCGGPDVLRGMDASEFDLDIIRMRGDRFLEQNGVCWAGGPYELRISNGPTMTINM